MRDDLGFIYNATTTSFSRRGWSKIGSTNDVSRRLRDLSSHSGAPEKFASWSWFCFESREIAQEVEKLLLRTLTNLGVRVSDSREFFSLDRYFSDAVKWAARELDVLTLGNYWLNAKNVAHEFESFIPCIYFLMNDDTVLERFDLTSYSTISLLQDIHSMPLTKDGYLSFAFSGEVSREFLRVNAYKPLIAVRLLTCEGNPLKPWALEKIAEFEEDHSYIFAFDPDWQAKIVTRNIER